MPTEKKEEARKDSDQSDTHRGYNEKTPAKPQGTFPPDSDDEGPVQKPESNKSKIPGGKPGDDVERQD